MHKHFGAVVLTALLAGATAAAEPGEPPAGAPPAAVDGPLLLPGEAVSEGSPGTRLEAGAEFVLWWLREGRLPATLTTSSPASRGLLGRPDTQTLYGDDRLETRHGDRFNGLRVTLGWWFDDADTLGVEGNAFFLERDSTYFKATSDGSTLLARPYYTADGQAASKIIAGPSPAGPLNGGFVGYSRIELFGQEANLVAPLLSGDGFRLEALGGARFLQMRDRTDLTDSGHYLPDQTRLFGLTDHYRTFNEYYGGQAGLRGELSRGRWFMNLRGEVGLGGNVEEVRAFGDRVYQTPAERVATPVGLTVRASNTGTFDRTALNMVSEAGVNVGCRLTRHAALFAGYTFLLWDSPLRSGDQVDPVVNTHPGTAPARPTIPFKEDLFWAQGLNAGLELSW